MSNATKSNVIIPKLKKFSKFLAAFPESTQNFIYFEKKDGLQRLFLSEIIDCKKRGYLNA